MIDDPQTLQQRPSELLELNFAEGEVPEWVQLIPAGPGIRGVDGRVWTMTDADAVAETFRNRGIDLPIDIEHATQIKGARAEPAPAMGWIYEMQDRTAGSGGGLWGRVKWNEEGERLLRARSYRYLSPVFSAAKSTGAVIPASRSPSQATEKVRTTRATYGRTLRASSRRLRLNMSSSKTCQGICPSASTMSSGTFKAWATGLQRASYQRRKLGHLIPAKGCSFWATPTVMSSGNRACLMLSPAGVQFKTDVNQTGTQIGLKNQCLSLTLLWQILDAVGWTGSTIQSSHLNRVILLNGEKYATNALTLNPAFTDWMMGWPPAWTDPARPVTGWSQWLRHARGMY